MRVKSASRIVGMALTLVVTVGTGAKAGAIQGSTSGIFVDPVAGSNSWMMVTGVGTNNFGWGLGYPPPPSRMTFTGTSIDTDLYTSFTFGTLSYFNGEIYPRTGVDGVTLDVAVNLTLPGNVAQSFLYPMQLINTPNIDGPNSNADYVFLPNAQATSTFSIDGQSYTLEFLGFGELVGDAFVERSEFHVLEGSSASAQLIGRITNPIPEPGTMILLGSGLLGLAAASRRKSKK